MDPVVCIEFFLKLNNGLISFIKSTRQSNHNVSLFKQKLLVPINLCLFFLDLSPFSFHLLKFLLILLSNQLLFLLKQSSELRCLFYLFTPNKHLRVESPYFLLKSFFLLFLLVELSVPFLQCVYGGSLILLGPSFFLFELYQMMRVVDMPCFLIKFLFQFPQLDLILPQKCPLVHVFIDSSLVFNFFRSSRKLKSRNGLPETLTGRGDHGHHSGLAVAS